MSQDWIIEILADVRQFAHKNAMLQLAEQLDDAIVTAAREMRSNPVPQRGSRSYDCHNRGLHRSAADHDLA